MKKFKKVVVLDSVIFYPEHRTRLEDIAEEIIEYNTCKSEEETLERIDGADCVISCWVDIPNKALDANKQLKTIAFWTHAYEHRIDKEYAKKHNVYLPCIPDYGTDSVAELAFGGLLELYSREAVKQEIFSKEAPRKFQEEIMRQVFDQVRLFNKNMKKNLTGSWFHENIKTGKKRITTPDQIKEQALKGLTVGFVTKPTEYEDIDEMLRIMCKGYHMNAIYALYDFPHHIDIAYRSIDNLLKESNVIIHNSRELSNDVLTRIKEGNYLATVDTANVEPDGYRTLFKRKLGIIGLGRIGARVAQIAIDGFDMEVQYFSKTRKLDIEKSLGVSYASLEDVLKNSDIISFHLPHIGAEDFITPEMIDLIPKGTTVLNVSVGNIFKDQDHLLDRFAANDLIGYLDVYKTLPPRQILRAKQEVLLSTYRLGWRTSATIGLKTHKLLSRMKEGLKKSFDLS